MCLYCIFHIEVDFFLRSAIITLVPMRVSQKAFLVMFFHVSDFFIYNSHVFSILYNEYMLFSFCQITLLYWVYTMALIVHVLLTTFCFLNALLAAHIILYLTIANCCSIIIFNTHKEGKIKQGESTYIIFDIVFKIDIIATTKQSPQ